MSIRTAIVVSFYNARSDHDLRNLLLQIQSDVEARKRTCVVVVNMATPAPLDLSYLEIPVSVIYRENTGMNIGAWDHGWRSLFDHSHFIFLQDECVIVDKDWLGSYEKKMSEPSIGLIGESMNLDMAWRKFFRHRKPYRSRDRRALYEDIKKLSIEPGASCRHLQSLVWGARRNVLEKMRGFPIGADKRQCILAEIGVSLKVASLGLRVEQVGDKRFTHVSHPQWDQDRMPARFLSPSPDQFEIS